MPPTHPLVRLAGRVWCLLAIGVAALALALVAATSPAGANHPGAGYENCVHESGWVVCTFDTPGTVNDWEIPSDVTQITVEVWGGGGGGGAAGYAASGGGGGGGGGGYATGTILVIPGQHYDIVVGAGGPAGASTGSTREAGSSGGSSSFGVTLLTATGGLGGDHGWPNHPGGAGTRAGGAGGTGGGSDAATTDSGETGGNGVAGTVAGGTATAARGGDGGDAGGPDGGAGGTGATWTPVSTTATGGNAPGGGGGGGKLAADTGTTGSTNARGGDGAPGAVLVMWQIPPTITKTFVSWDNGVATWDIVIDNTDLDDPATVLIEEDTEVLSVEVTTQGQEDACGQDPEFTQDDDVYLLECEVPGDGSLTIRVTTAAPVDCNEVEGVNYVNNVVLYWAHDVDRTVALGEESDSHFVSSDTEECDENGPVEPGDPTITKEPIADDFDGGDWTDGYSLALQQAGWMVTVNKDESQRVRIIEANVDGIIGHGSIAGGAAASFIAANPDYGCTNITGPVLTALNAAISGTLGFTIDLVLDCNGAATELEIPVYRDAPQSCVEEYVEWNRAFLQVRTTILVFGNPVGIWLPVLPQSPWWTDPSPVTVPLQLDDCDPEITKTALPYNEADQRAEWTITVNKTESQEVRIRDADVDGIVGSLPTDCTGDIAGDGLECDGDQVELTITVYRNAEQRCEIGYFEDNTADLDVWVPDNSWVFVATSDEASVEVDPNADRCPTVTKQGTVTDHDGLYTWTIRINNSHAGAVDDRVVQITDPNVTLVAHVDCSKVGDVITCPDVDAGDVIVLTVTRLAGNPTCHPIHAFNRITAIVVNGESLTVPGSLNAVLATRLGDPRLCPTLTPPPPQGWTPTPTPTPGAPLAGCLNPPVAHATWHPTPVVPGRTISIWGGGNVSEFPLPIATSYWTTVNGLWVGYIPFAPAWVNANFFTHFPNGDIPPCKGFIISHFR